MIRPGACISGEKFSRLDKSLLSGQYTHETHFRFRNTEITHFRFRNPKVTHFGSQITILFKEKK